MSDDEEEYEFDYSDEDEDMEDGEADLHVQIENQYYVAKQHLEGDPPDRRAALGALEQVLALEPEHSDWGFKALKRIVKLLFELQQHADAMRRYEQLLGYTRSAVTRNVGEKGINSILDFVSTSKVRCAASQLRCEVVQDAEVVMVVMASGQQNWEILQRFYETTLETLKEARNEVRTAVACRWDAVLGG